MSKPAFSLLSIRLRQGLVVLSFFAFSSAVLTWPLIWHLSNSLPGRGEPAGNARWTGSIAHQLFQIRFNLYATNASHPLNNGLALSELGTEEGLLDAPVVWPTNNSPLAFNRLNLSSYKQVLGGIQGAKASYEYNYAIFYPDSKVKPAEHSYKLENRIYSDGEPGIEVYRTKDE
ncbi:MAG TPA: hypothetical protein VH186_33315 [Chloroflexia bacterium]|nr:hypothetical protein [Chloroflexia bacterium]